MCKVEPAVEKWKPVEGYEGLYAVSNLGRVKSLERTRVTKGGGTTNVQERILKHAIDKFGYCKIALYKNGNGKYFKVHRLVAMAFIPNLYNKQEINHIDGDKTNNAVCNLEWATPAENKRHAYAMGLNGGEHLTHRKGVTQYDANKRLIATFPSITEASKKTGARHSSIWACCNHRYNTAGGYIWKYNTETGCTNEICTT